MKKGPFQLEQVEFPMVEVRAHPHIDHTRVSEELPVSVSGLVTYEVDGDHFAALTITQASKEYAYTFQVQVFTTFRINVAVAKEMFRPFNPGVIAVNVSRILYSSAREMLAVVSSRSPYGTAVLPTIFIEPSDISLDFEDKKHAEILSKYFEFSDEQIAELDRAIEERARLKKPKASKSQKKT